MFLKLFPRYAGRARRGATVAGDHLRGTAVVVENAPKSLSRHDGASVIRACRQRCEELVDETLVVPFCVIVHYVFGYRCAQVSLTERYEAVETLSTYGENESFRVCVQIRTIGVLALFTVGDVYVSLCKKIAYAPFSARRRLRVLFWL